MSSQPSPNFAFLAYHDARLVALGTQAEEHFAGDANVSLYKLRQFCEVLAKRAAAKVGLLLDPREDLRRVIDALAERSAIGATQRDLFHQLRRAGNDAVHDLGGSQSEALHQLKVAHQLAIWFQRTRVPGRRSCDLGSEAEFAALRIAGQREIAAGDVAEEGGYRGGLGAGRGGGEIDGDGRRADAYAAG